MKSSSITNWIKWSETEYVMLPDKVVNSKLLKKILSIRVFELSVTLAGCRISDYSRQLLFLPGFILSHTVRSLLDLINQYYSLLTTKFIYIC